MKQRTSCPDSSRTKSVFLWNWASVFSQISHLGDLYLSFEFWGVHKALRVSWWMCSVWIWVLWMSRENTRFPICFGWPATPKHDLDGWMSLENVLLQDGAETIPCPGTTGCSLDGVCFYSTLFLLETPSASCPLQPYCCNWDMGPWSCPPQQANHENQFIQAT